MPRLYAHIRKVSNPEFKIKLTWLEAYSEDQRERAWVRADLPVACGKFRRGSSKYTSDRLLFSHQLQCEKDKRDLYIVYSRKGERPFSRIGIFIGAQIQRALGSTSMKLWRFFLILFGMLESKWLLGKSDRIY